MAQTASVTKLATGGDWLARDIDSWVVGVPCPGGSGRFYFNTFGGASKALAAARKFRDEAIKLLEGDREYYKKHGEHRVRVVLNVRNRSGLRGVHRIVSPNLYEGPRVTWMATWTNPDGKQESKAFSTCQYPEDVCKRKAIELRRKMTAHYKRSYS